MSNLCACPLKGTQRACRQGIEAAQAAGVQEVAVFAAASETFSRRNINCTVGESLKRFEDVIAAARASGIAVRGYVSCVVNCPYEVAGYASDSSNQYGNQILISQGRAQHQHGPIKRLRWWDGNSLRVLNLCISALFEQTAPA